MKLRNSLESCGEKWGRINFNGCCFPGHQKWCRSLLQPSPVKAPHYLFITRPPVLIRPPERSSDKITPWLMLAILARDRRTNAEGLQQWAGLGHHSYPWCSTQMSNSTANNARWDCVAAPSGSHRHPRSL